MSLSWVIFNDRAQILLCYHIHISDDECQTGWTNSLTFFMILCYDWWWISMDQACQCKSSRPLFSLSLSVFLSSLSFCEENVWCIWTHSVAQINRSASEPIKLDMDIDEEVGWGRRFRKGSGLSGQECVHTYRVVCGSMTNEQSVRGRPDAHIHDCCDLHLAGTSPLITPDNGSVSEKKIYIGSTRWCISTYFYMLSQQ